MAGYKLRIDFEVKKFVKKFWFGPWDTFKWEVVHEISIVVQMEEDEEEILSIKVFKVEALFPMLCGMYMLETWNTK